MFRQSWEEGGWLSSTVVGDGGSLRGGVKREQLAMRPLGGPTDEICPLCHFAKDMESE